MRQSLGMSQQLNIMIIFILVVFAILAASLSYYKAFKINNVIVNSIEKYEGYNSLSEGEIKNKLSGLGYQTGNARCNNKKSESKNEDGYCVYYNGEAEDGSYSYKVVSYMAIDLPLMNLIAIPVTTTTKQISCLGSGDCKIEVSTE